MIEERPIPLLDALEGRADTLLRLWRQERESRQALQQRLDELEAAHLALTEKSHQLVEKNHQLLEERRELEASRLELEEENRELDEQNRELEEHNRHLHERLNSQGEGHGTGFPRPARRSQGLSALIGRSATSPNDVGARFIERSAEGADAGAKSPDKSGSYNAAAAATAAATTDADVGARLVGRSAEATDAGANTPSPDKSGSYDAAAATTNTAAAATAAAAITDADVGARLVGRSAECTDAPSPQALLAEWYQRYPGAFFKGHTRPLKVGIHEELAEREPWPEKLVRRALACYVNLPRYLKAVREGAERIDLAGQPAGGVDAQAAEHARKKLDRLQAERRGKVSPGGTRRQEAAPKHARPGSQSADKPVGKSGDRQGDRKARFKAGPSGKAPAAGGDAARPSALKAATKPQHAAESRPVTMEEKLAALVAKHRHS